MKGVAMTTTLDLNSALFMSNLRSNRRLQQPQPVFSGNPIEASEESLQCDARSLGKIILMQS